MKYLINLNNYNKIDENEFSSNYNLVHNTINDYFSDVNLVGNDIQYVVSDGFSSYKDGNFFGHIKDGELIKNDSLEYAFTFRVDICLYPDSNTDPESIMKGIRNIYKLCESVKEILSYLKRDSITKNYKSNLIVDDIIRLDSEAFGDDASFNIIVRLFSDTYMTKEEIRKYNESI